MLKRIIEIILGYKGLFSLDRLVTDSGWARREVQYRINRLEREGLISRVRETAHNNGEAGAPTLRVLYVATKGLKKRLENMSADQKKDTSWDKMWRTMRVMRRFTRADLVQLTGARDENVKYYTQMLKKAGYVRVSRVGNVATWILIKDPGPQRPRIGKMKGKGKGKGKVEVEVE